MTASPSIERRLHADDDRFLADIEVAEAADQAHAVQLAGLLLEAADQQHVAIVFQKLGGTDLGLISLGLAFEYRHLHFLRGGFFERGGAELW